MTKQTTAAKTTARKTAGKAPQEAPNALQALAATLAPASQPVAASAPQDPPKAPPVVALRGGPAIASVKLTGKNYRVGAKHNQEWWALCQKACAEGNGTASVEKLVKDLDVPAIFVGYVIRRGYMQAA